MLVEIILPAEKFVANVAVEHFLAGVRHDVTQQMLLPAERLVARRLIALEWSQTNVRLQMLHEEFFALENLPANIAHREVEIRRLLRRLRLGPLRVEARELVQLLLRDVRMSLLDRLQLCEILRLYLPRRLDRFC